MHAREAGDILAGLVVAQAYAALIVPLAVVFVTDVTEGPFLVWKQRHEHRSFYVLAGLLLLVVLLLQLLLVNAMKVSRL